MISHLGLASTVGGVLLWLLEVFAAVLCCAYLWEICDALGTEHWERRIAHLDNWPGYKSGALNYALRRLTSPEADVIGVVDSDYQIEPGFLRRCAPPFRYDHSYHVAIGLTYHEFAHAELVSEFLGNPVRFRDSDPDRVLDHPLTGVAEIKNRLLPRPLTTQLGG